MTRKIVLVEYHFTTSRLFAFGIRSDFDQPAVMEIETDPRALHAEIARAATDDFHDHVGEMAASPALAACIAPVLRWSSPGDLVCIVPAGPLFYVPLHAVAVAGAPLVSRNAIFYAPTASALRYCVRRRRSPSPIASATAFGNPEGDLVSAEAEARLVADVLDARLRLRAEVTRESLIAAFADSEVVHFAGHGEFVHEDPLASGLVLHDGEILSAREIFAVSAPALRLVTLSGCVTGYNGVHPGDELVGFSRSLLHAGASSLLLTLWEIEDESGAALMEAFYRRWLAGASKVDALRDAQLHVYDGHPADPSFWAPFVLFGDWV